MLGAVERVEPRVGRQIVIPGREIVSGVNLALSPAAWDEVKIQRAADSGEIDSRIVEMEKGEELARDCHQQIVRVAPQEIDAALAAIAHHDAIHDLVVGDAEKFREKGGSH